MLRLLFPSLWLRWAVKRYARTLHAQLVKSYGASEYYTAMQIRAAVHRLRLPEQILALAYAAFMPKSAYYEVMGRGIDGSYDELRALFTYHEPVSMTSGPPNPPSGIPM